MQHTCNFLDQPVARCSSRTMPLCSKTLDHTMLKFITRLLCITRNWEHLCFLYKYQGNCSDFTTSFESVITLAYLISLLQYVREVKSALKTQKYVSVTKNLQVATLWQTKGPAKSLFCLTLSVTNWYLGRGLRTKQLYLRQGTFSSFYPFELLFKHLLERKKHKYPTNQKSTTQNKPKTNQSKNSK